MLVTLGHGLGPSKPRASLQPTYAINAPSPQDIGQPAGFSTSEASFIIDITDDTPAPSSNRALLSLEGSSLAANALYIQKRATGTAWRFYVVSGSSVQYMFDLTGTNMYAGRHKIAVAMKNNYLRIAVNGYIVGRDDSISFLANVANGINIGQFDGATQIYDKTIHRFEYYNTALTEAQLSNFTLGNGPGVSAVYDGALDVITFMGDSISSGRASGTPSYTNAPQMKLISNAGVLGAYADPYDTNTGDIFSNLDDGSSAAGSFAGYTIDALISATGRNAAALTANKGGSKLSDEWDLLKAVTGGTGCGPAALSALQQISMANQFGFHKAAVITLGANDAITAVAQATIQAKMELLIAEVWRSRPQKIVVMGLHQWHSGTGATQTNWNNARAAQQAAAAASGAAFVDTSSIAGKAADEAHLDQSGNQSVGGLLAAAIAG